MIKKFSLSEKSDYDKFCKEFGKYKVENLFFQEKTSAFSQNHYLRDYSVFNIYGTTVTLINKRELDGLDLTIGLDKKIINTTIEKIKSKGFKLEEIN